MTKKAATQKPRSKPRSIDLKDRGEHDRKKRELAAARLLPARKSDPIYDYVDRVRDALKFQPSERSDGRWGSMTQQDYIAALVMLRDEIGAALEEASTEGEEEDDEDGAT